MLSFYDMEIKFGCVAAYHVLAEIEKTANISSWEVAETDPETRLANAIYVQDCMNHSSAQLAA